MSAFQPGGTKGCVDDEDKCEEWAILGECECPLPRASIWAIAATAAATAGLLAVWQRAARQPGG